MKPSDQHPLKISASVHKKTLSKEQKRFNQLIAKIDEQKKKLEEVKASIAGFRELFGKEYVPAKERLNQAYRRFILRADKIASTGKLSQREKRTLSDMIDVFCHNNLKKDGDPELKEIYNRWCDADFDAEYEENKLFAEELMRERMQQDFGVELPEDFDMENPEASFAQFEEKMRDALGNKDEPQSTPSRKKSAKEIAKEVRLEKAQKEVSLSIREVYRKLVSVLHPDREMDDQLRAEKTVLMQKVNIAYEERDLLQLLALQMELEHIDQAHLDGLSEHKLQHYVQILSDQERELRDEIQYVTAQFYAAFDTPEEGGLLMQIRNLKRDIARLKESVKILERDTKSCQSIRELKAILSMANA